MSAKLQDAQGQINPQGQARIGQTLIQCADPDPKHARIVRGTDLFRPSLVALSGGGTSPHQGRDPQQGALQLDTHHLQLPQGLNPTQLRRLQRAIEAGMITEVELHRCSPKQGLGGLEQQGKTTKAEIQEIRLQPAPLGLCRLQQPQPHGQHAAHLQALIPPAIEGVTPLIPKH